MWPSLSRRSSASLERFRQSPKGLLFRFASATRKTTLRPVSHWSDAAHTIHPLAGQGANLGFGDVRTLLDELSRARKAGLGPADELVLARYQRRRKGENLTMMAAMEGFKQLFGRDELPVRWLRNTGLRWLNQLGPVKNRIAAEAMGLNG